MLQADKPIVLAITGASGFIYGLKILETLLFNKKSVDLIISKHALTVAKLEHDVDLEAKNLAELKAKVNFYLKEQGIDFETKQLRIWSEDNIAASCASGSYRTQGMIIAPCSTATLANIAHGTSHNLVSRSADVTLKERQKLILLLRETPLSTLHLKNALSLSEAGAVIVPAIPAFYYMPKTIEDHNNFIVGKTLDAFGLEYNLFKRWATY
jgi:4-hydroxy-3-polyprenylbenzoate decarboxylase